MVNIKLPSLPSPCSIVVILITVLLLGFSYYSLNGNNNDLQELQERVKTEQSKLRDTIKVYDTIILKADTVYKVKYRKLFKETPRSVDSLFDLTFARDSGDTTKYPKGYTQLRKALDAENRRDRDSIQKDVLKIQLAKCTTTVNTVVNDVDTTVTPIVKESIWAKVKLASTVAVIAIVSFGIGYGVASN